AIIVVPSRIAMRWAFISLRIWSICRTLRHLNWWSLIHKTSDPLPFPCAAASEIPRQRAGFGLLADVWKGNADRRDPPALRVEGEGHPRLLAAVDPEEPFEERLDASGRVVFRLRVGLPRLGGGRADADPLHGLGAAFDDQDLDLVAGVAEHRE